MENEITVRKPLLNEKGELNERGWAKHQVLQYDRRAVKAFHLRIKEWDYYLMMNREHAVALTIADNSYMGLMSASVLDFNTGFQHTNSVMTILPCGKIKLPSDSSKGVTCFENKRIYLRFEAIEKGRTVECRYQDFQPGKELYAKFQMEQPFEDSIVMATPWKEDRKAFYYNQKINCMSAEGFYEFDGRRVKFDKADSFGTLDWGRGVWTRSNTWYWGSGNSWINGKRFGFNLGYGFGDTSAASENVLFYDGIAHKLEQVTFQIGDEDNLMAPWKIFDKEKRLSLSFVPVMDRAAKMNALIFSSDQHQVFGKVTGYATLDNGTRLQIEELPCFFEKVKNVY